MGTNKLGSYKKPSSKFCLILLFKLKTSSPHDLKTYKGIQKC